MSEIFRTCAPPTCEVSASVISLPELASGPMPSAAPEFPTPPRSGPEARLASLSARQARAEGLLTSGTSGPRSTISSASAALQSILESRFRARTDSSGSTLFRLTWKRRVTPAGRWISARRASVPRTPDTGFTWSPSGFWIEAARKQELGRRRSGGSDLQAQALLAGWTTPSATDGERGGEMTEGMSGSSLTQQARLTASGELRTGSSAATGSGGQLSPEHSRWLMGLPSAWDDCGARATPLSRRSRKRSSGPITSGK